SARSRATSSDSYVRASRRASASSASPASRATPSPNATCVLGRPRRSASSSSAGRSSWTSEKVWTSSSAAAAGSASSTRPPQASATARQSTGRTRLPPDSSEYLSACSRPPSSRANRSEPRYASTVSRSSSAGRIGQGARSRQLTFDLARQLGELGDEVDGGVAVDVVGRSQPLELLAALVQRPEELLRARQRLVHGSRHVTPPPLRVPRAPGCRSRGARRLRSRTAWPARPPR